MFIYMKILLNISGVFLKYLNNVEYFTPFNAADNDIKYVCKFMLSLVSNYCTTPELFIFADKESTN